MHLILGRMALTIYLLLLALVAIPGVGLLAFTSWVILTEALTPEEHGHGLLLLVIASPVWAAGIVAGLDLVLVARRRAVSVVHALGVAAVMIVGGMLLAGFQGVGDIVRALLTRPADLALGWPTTVLWTSDGSGATYYNLASPAIWLGVAFVTVGFAVVAAFAVEGPSRSRADLAAG